MTTKRRARPKKVRTPRDATAPAMEPERTGPQGLVNNLILGIGEGRQFTISYPTLSAVQVKKVTAFVDARSNGTMAVTFLSPSPLVTQMVITPIRK